MMRRARSASSALSTQRVLAASREPRWAHSPPRPMTVWPICPQGSRICRARTCTISWGRFRPNRITSCGRRMRWNLSAASNAASRSWNYFPHYGGHSRSYYHLERNWAADRYASRTLVQRPPALRRQLFSGCARTATRKKPVFDFRARFCHSAPMKTHAFGLTLRANAPEGQKRFPISM